MNSHRCIIGLGSNSNHHEMLAYAREQLRMLFVDIVFSREQFTRPIRFSARQTLFLNQVASFSTSLDSDAVRSALKRIETEAGRKPVHHDEEKIVLDLDLIVFDSLVLKPKDYMREYIKEGIREISNG